MAVMRTATAVIAWHELLTQSVDRAEAFYAQLLGWSRSVWKPGVRDYVMVHADGSDQGAFVQLAHPGLTPRWLPYVVVPDADAVAAAAERGAGRVLRPPYDIPDVGRATLVADPEGATIAAISTDDDELIVHGAFAWDDLGATDLTAARRFYADVFGWEAKPVHEGYEVFGAGGTRVAGLMPRPPAAPPAWLTYLGTDDVGDAVARATAMGAMQIVGPTRVDGMRFAVLVDPTGAAFGLLAEE